eukprot:862666-Amphidinium_carterae.1
MHHAKCVLFKDTSQVDPSSLANLRCERMAISQPTGGVVLWIRLCLLQFHVHRTCAILLASAASYVDVSESFASLGAHDMCPVSTEYGAELTAEYVSKVYFFGRGSIGIQGDSGKGWQIRTIIEPQSRRIFAFPWLLNSGGPHYTSVYMHDASMSVHGCTLCSKPTADRSRLFWTYFPNLA